MPGVISSEAGILFWCFVCPFAVIALVAWAARRDDREWAKRISASEAATNAVWAELRSERRALAELEPSARHSAELRRAWGGK